MAERVQTLKMPSSMPVVIQLDNTALDTFLKGLMQALQEMGTEVAEARSKASSSEATAAHLIQQVSGLKDELEKERKKMSAIEGSINTKHENEEGGLKNLEAALGQLREQATKTELAHVDKMSSFDRRLRDAEKMEGNLTAQSQEMADLRFQLKSLEGAQENLSRAIAEMCTVQQHRSLEQNHEVLREESGKNQQDMVSMRAKIDALGIRFKKMENAVQGIEGTLELEDDSVPPDMLEDMLLMKTQMEKLHTTVASADKAIDDLKKLTENEGGTLEVALKQIDQISDKMPTIDKRLYTHEHKLDTALERLEDHRQKLMGYDAPPAPTGHVEGADLEGHEALEMVKQLKSDLLQKNLTTTDVIHQHVYHANQLETVHEDIRHLKAAISRIKGASAVAGVVDRAEDGVGKKEIAICLQSVEHLWQVVQDIGERNRAELIAQNNDGLAEALFGNFATAEERAALFKGSSAPVDSKESGPAPNPPSPDSKRPGRGGRPKALAAGEREQGQKERGSSEAAIKACWGIEDTVHVWKPTNGVVAPWIGKGIITATRTHTQLQAQKEKGEKISIDDIKSLKRELENLNDLVDDLAQKADKQSEETVITSKHLRATSKDASHARSEAELSSNMAKEALAQVARSVSDTSALQTLMQDFVSKVDAEMRNKADCDMVATLVSQENLGRTLEELAGTWGEQLQRAHADVNALKRGLKHVNDRSGAGLAKPKPSLYWTRPGIDPIISPGRAGTSYRLSHERKQHKASAKPHTAAPSSDGRRGTTALPFVNPIFTDGGWGSADGAMAQEASIDLDMLERAPALDPGA